MANDLKAVYNPADEQKNIIKDLKRMSSEQTIISGFNNSFKCQECNKEQLELDNKKIRNFAAYNIMNREARILLKIIYDKKYIEANKFKESIIKGFKKRNKSKAKLRNADIDKLANNKYETIFNGLKFLNIIEPSENNDEIMLTNDGRDFVREYIEDKEEIL